MEASGQRGQIGRQTYELVQELIRNEGLKPTEAFARVADQTGRTAATVATAFYRVARTTPDSGVKFRPRTKSGSAATSRARADRAPTTASLVRDLRQAVEALARHVESLESEAAQSRADRALVEQIKRLAAS